MIKTIGQFFAKRSTCLFFILLIVFISYLPVLKSDFLQWDDDVHVYNNILVRSLDFEHLKEIFTTRVNSIYIPLTTLSFALEYHSFGYNPSMYHLDNLLLHLLIVMCVFSLALRLGLTQAGAAIVSILFGLHPMHVESVAWVTERKDVLYAFFYMLAVLSYIKFISFPPSLKKQIPSRNYFWLTLAYFFGILSMLSKPMALSLPVILFLLDWFVSHRIERRVIVEKTPLILIVAGIAWVTYMMQARNPIQNVYEAMLIWPWTFVFYLRQFLFPFFSVPVYRLPYPIHISNLEYLFSLLAFALIIFSLIRFRRSRWFIFASLFYFFSIFFLLRFDDLKDTNIVADRFMYLPSLGFCLWAGWGAERLLKHSKLNKILLPALALLVVLLSFKIYNQCLVWQNSISLWQHQLKFFPYEYIALNNLANVLRDENEYKDAEKSFRQIVKAQKQGLPIQLKGKNKEGFERVNHVISLYKRAAEVGLNFEDASYNLGKLYHDVEDYALAFEHYKKALQINPQSKDGLFSLAKYYMDLAKYDLAVSFFKKTLETNKEDEEIYINIILALNKAFKKSADPLLQQARDSFLKEFVALINKKGSRTKSLLNLGLLYYEIGDYQGAVSAYRAVLDYNPNNTLALFNLGNVYRQLGMLREAKDMYTKVISITNWHSDSYVGLGIISSQQGKDGEAISYFEKAVKNSSKNSLAYFNLGFIYEKRKEFKKALGAYLKTIEIDPAHTNAYYNIGNVYAALNDNKKALEAYINSININPNYIDAWVNASIISVHEKDFEAAIRYLDEAILLGYKPPEGFVKALEPYRKGTQNPSAPVSQ